MTEQDKKQIATNVGSRYGKPIILTVMSGKMHQVRADYEKCFINLTASLLCLPVVFHRKLALLGRESADTLGNGC